MGCVRLMQMPSITQCLGAQRNRKDTAGEESIVVLMDYRHFTSIVGEETITKFEKFEDILAQDDGIHFLKLFKLWQYFKASNKNKHNSGYYFKRTWKALIKATHLNTPDFNMVPEASTSAQDSLEPEFNDSRTSRNDQDLDNINIAMVNNLPAVNPGIDIAP